MVDAADFARALVDGEIGNDGERDGHGTVGVNDEAAQLLDAETVLFTEAHDNIDHLVFFAELGGDAALDFVAHEIGDGAEVEAVFGQAVALVDDLDFGVTALERRAHIGEAGDGFGEERFGLAAEAFEGGEIVAANLDFDGTLKTEERGVGNFELGGGQSAEAVADALDEARLGESREAGFEFDGEAGGVFAGGDGGAGAFLGADGEGGALDFGLGLHGGVDLRGDVRGAFERRADGESDVEVELTLADLRDEFPADAWHDDKPADEKRHGAAAEDRVAMAKGSGDERGIAALQRLVAALEPFEAAADHAAADGGDAAPQTEGGHPECQEDGERHGAGEAQHDFQGGAGDTEDDRHRGGYEEQDEPPPRLHHEPVPHDEVQRLQRREDRGRAAERRGDRRHGDPAREPEHGGDGQRGEDEQTEPAPAACTDPGPAAHVALAERFRRDKAEESGPDA